MKKKIKASKPTSSVAVPTVLDVPPTTLKLDLAAGQNVRDGFEGVDIFPGSTHVVNLMEYPWPWADSSVAELNCSHFAEHIPMIFVNDFGREVPMGAPGARDAFFRFMDECHRVLVPGGWMTLIVPSGKSDRGFQDPTHRRFFVPATFGYLSADIRKSYGLDHYAVTCDFGVNVDTACAPVLNTLSPQVSARKFDTEWNAAWDYHARLLKIASVATPQAT